MKNKTYHIHQASILMRQQHSGVLSTNSLSMEGFPFGSVTPFLMTEGGDVVIYASDIAQHSRNMKVDAKVSLCVHDPRQGDSQANARVTFLGQAQADTVSKSWQNQYFTLFPKAKQYVRAHDFRFYLIKVERVRYIGGFGEIHWFSKREWHENKQSLAHAAQAAIDHMHEDHADALAKIVSQATGKQVIEQAAQMLSCFQHGFHYQLDMDNTHTTGFIPFETPINENHGLRQAMVILTKRATSRSSETDSAIASV